MVIREDIDIKKIADMTGCTYSEDDGYKCIDIGFADWDNTGNEMDLVLRYKYGIYNNEWKRTGIGDRELYVMLRQTTGTMSLSAMNFEQAFTFVAGLVLIKKDIGKWRTNYMAAEYNRELEKTLAALK